MSKIFIKITKNLNLNNKDEFSNTVSLHGVHIVRLDIRNRNVSMYIYR